MPNQSELMQIYKARNNILNILESIYDYDISEYSGFSISEIDAMMTNNQLDMFLTNKKQEGGQLKPVNKTYIKFLYSVSMNPSLVSSIVDDLYESTDTLKEDDCLCIIHNSEPNDSMIKYLNTIYETNKIFIVIHNIKRLQFNILEHSLVPSIHILSKKESEELRKRYKVDNDKQLPEISRFDPVALATCLRPGQICKFIRNSPSSLTTPYYRICI